MNTDTSTRKYELDWLRVLAILFVFLYHSTRFFDLGDWHIKNVSTYVWLRGKSDINNGYTDSVWLQVDDQIGAQGRSVRLGNWLDVHPPGVYGWASDTDDPIAIQLKHGGAHTIRIQPRQIPHRIDQIWLSRSQYRIPNTSSAIGDER